MVTEPLVSVILPTYNPAEFIGYAIASVLTQTYSNFELIIIDDGSTDVTLEVVSAFRDNRIRYIYQRNTGLSSARNAGLRASRGKYITYLDADDIFMVHKLEVLLPYMHSGNYGLVHGHTHRISETGEFISVLNSDLPEDTSRLLLGNPIHVGSVLIKKEWQDYVGFFDENLKSYEDWDMWLRFAMLSCPTKSVTNIVSCYRDHPGQMTKNISQMLEAQKMVLDKVKNTPGMPLRWNNNLWKAYRHHRLACIGNQIF